VRALRVNPPRGDREGRGTGRRRQFDSTRRYGWDSPVSTRYRNTGVAYEIDTFAYSKVERHWSIELANGDYDVYVVCGDPSYAQGPQRVRANGVTIIDDVETGRASYADASESVRCGTAASTWRSRNDREHHDQLRRGRADRKRPEPLPLDQLPALGIVGAGRVRAGLG
jgi:hypothetical protein